ncbi:MAG: hypothetical protein RLO52_45165 [Sandaracinaceae bacterium]|nr:hypothetical protein [Myxococcales bacterium]
MRHLDIFASPVAALAGVLALAAGCASAPPPRSGLDQQYLAEEMDRELELRAEIDRVCERRTCTAERRREVLERCSSPEVDCDIGLLLGLDSEVGASPTAETGGEAHIALDDPGARRSARGEAPGGR